MRLLAIAFALLAAAATFPSLAAAKTTHPASTHSAKAHARPAAGAGSPITSEQAKAVAELAKAGLAIQADLNDAIAQVSGDDMPRRRGNDSVLFIECFQVLEGATAELTGNLKELLVSTATATLAKNADDMNTSLGFTRLALDDVGSSVALVEKITSQRPAPVCRASHAYRDQVDRLQRFAHDITGVTDDLSVATGPQ